MEPGAGLPSVVLLHFAGRRLRPENFIQKGKKDKSIGNLPEPVTAGALFSHLPYVEAPLVNGVAGYLVPRDFLEADPLLSLHPSWPADAKRAKIQFNAVVVPIGRLGQKRPGGVLDEFCPELGRMLEAIGLSSVELPEETAQINDILNALPGDVTERVLVEYVNELFAYREP